MHLRKKKSNTSRGLEERHVFSKRLAVNLHAWSCFTLRVLGPLYSADNKQRVFDISQIRDQEKLRLLLRNLQQTCLKRTEYIYTPIHLDFLLYPSDKHEPTGVCSGCVKESISTQKRKKSKIKNCCFLSHSTLIKQ